MNSGGDSNASEEEEYQYSDDEDEYQYDASETVGTNNDMGGNKRQRSMMDTSSSSSTTSASSSCAKPAEYRVLQATDLAQEQELFVKDLAQVLDIPASTAGILLRYFHWDKEKLFEQYCVDPEATRKRAGVEFLGRITTTTSLSSSHEEDKTTAPTTTCPICCDDFEPQDVFGVGCGHRFCKDCWDPYLTFKIKEGPGSVYTTCPQQGCGEVVTDEVFQMLVKPTDFELYTKYILRSYVDINKSVKWCPAPSCTNAITSMSSDGISGLVSSMVQCTCGHQFCIKCNEERHLPVACRQLELWQEKCKNESETANWILANTKKCPKCSVRIEKNQGCNHMVCRHCKAEFCWICLGSWKEHGTGTGGYYKCNRYNPSGEDGSGQDSKLSDAAKAKAELDRYLHYYQRYANHNEAGKYAERMRGKTEERMVELQEQNAGSSWIDVQFLKVATEQLIMCRQVLKYTYVLAYYLPNGKEKNLFEYLQVRPEYFFVSSGKKKDEVVVVVVVIHSHAIFSWDRKIWKKIQSISRGSVKWPSIRSIGRKLLTLRA